MKTEGSPTRAGRYITQLTGYKAFIPVPLPPDPPIAWDEELQNLLSKADMALGRLDGIATILPDPDLFVAMYVRKEAVLSSQIEGTRATMDGIQAERTLEAARRFDPAMESRLRELYNWPVGEKPSYAPPRAYTA